MDPQKPVNSAQHVDARNGVWNSTAGDQYNTTIQGDQINYASAGHTILFHFSIRSR